MPEFRLDLAGAVDADVALYLDGPERRHAPGLRV
jgi:hypothetical protein